MKWSKSYSQFVVKVLDGLWLDEKLTRLGLEKEGRKLGINDKQIIKELTELAVLEFARSSIKETTSLKKAYDLLVHIYKTQPVSSFRSSQSEILRQFSTPLPIAYLLGIFIDGQNPEKRFLEPSAGNGLLTIGLDPNQTHVNELDQTRFKVLHHQNFWAVTNEDAAMPMRDVWKNYDGVIANPPFGKLRERAIFRDIPILFMDHLMMLRALEGMKDNGKAAFVTGKHMSFDQKGRISVSHGRAFFTYLFQHYNVVDMIPIDGKKLYSRQGTGLDVMLILIDGRKEVPGGSAPIKSTFNDTVIEDHQALFNRIENHFPMKKNDLNERAKKLMARLQRQVELGAPYAPTSDGCFVLRTETPDRMAFELHEAVKRIEKAVGGDIDNYVRHRLGYPTKALLCNSLAAEQIDAVGMALYNIEAKGQGCIIGDQTGIGKGRVAAALIRYAVKQGLKPIFLTEKANLFSDIYRDLNAIGSASLTPFIVNTRESKTDIKDEEGKVIYSAPTKARQQKVFESANLQGYDFVLATYSQFNSMTKRNKRDFLLQVSKDTILIMDESHNASGESQTGFFLRQVVHNTRSTIFLSATFAKRPDNMPIYAMKTAIRDANMSSAAFIGAIKKGGVALQEVIASQLVAEGQMIRRERSTEGVEVEYRILTERKEEHFAVADNITHVMRDIIKFQQNYIEPIVSDIDAEYAKTNGEVRTRGGTSELGISNITYFSKVFNVIHQMLFALKAEDVAKAAIEKLREGKKPVIAFASTMGSFLNQLIEEEGVEPGDGQSVNTDFSLILKNGLDGVMRYTETDALGQKHFDHFTPNDLPMEGRAEYWRIMGHIESAVSGITISPIDIILDRIREAGYSIQEVTGRTLRVDFDPGNQTGKIERIKKVNVNDAFASFNNNETDVLLINQAGSTGASAHAIETSKVPKDQVKKRSMIILQMELNIDTEMQKRGRTDRTGQLFRSEYTYINSAIPAEVRNMMMLSQKLKSLDANTSSNQNQNEEMMKVPDFLNKYGDQVVTDYLFEDTRLHADLGHPSLGNEGGATAHRVSGRMAVMPVSVQDRFYKEVVERYLEYIDFLKQTGDYDLEVEQLNLEAKTISRQIVVAGNGGTSHFGTDTYLEKMEVNALKKPLKSFEVKNNIDSTLNGRTPDEYIEDILQKHEVFTTQKLAEEKEGIKEDFTRRVKILGENPRLNKILSEEGSHAHTRAIDKEIESLEIRRDEKLRAAETSFKGKRQQFSGLVKFFRVGRVLSYQKHNFSDKVMATFLGFDIKENIKNPYAPSAYKLRFAIASPVRMLSMPGSFQAEINAIKGASLDLEELTIEQMLEKWDEAVQGKNHDRVIRFMQTGNLVQGYRTGKLISYTTHDNKVAKGVLLPEKDTKKDSGTHGVTVNLLRAMGHIRSAKEGSPVKLSNSLTITRVGQDYQLRIPASKKKGGEFFMDEKLNDVTIGKKFEKVSDTMRGTISGDNLDKLLTILDGRFKVNIELTLEQFERIKEEVERNSGRINKIITPPKEKMSFDIEAKALIFKLKLLKKRRGRA